MSALTGTTTVVLYRSVITVLWRPLSSGSRLMTLCRLSCAKNFKKRGETDMSEEDRQKLELFIDSAKDRDESFFPNMTYEQGMEAVLFVLDGGASAEEVTS